MDCHGQEGIMIIEYQCSLDVLLPRANDILSIESCKASPFGGEQFERFLIGHTT